jgi:negative regulator of genetic competence, sporulation and motility
LKFKAHEALLSIDWEELRYKGEIDEAAKRPVEMSPAEQMMTNDVEELSEDMRRETEEEVRAGVGKTSLAFMDLENMSSTAKLACLLAATLFFSSVGYFFYTMLFVKEADTLKVRREKLLAKRAAKK